MEPAVQTRLEEVYAHLQSGGFLAALDLLGRLLPSSGDEAVTRAADVFLDEFFRTDHAGSPHEAQILEKLLLLDRAGRILLQESRREDVVLRLVRMHESEPDLALSFARFMPEHPVCRALIEDRGPAESSRLTAPGAPVAVHRVGSNEDAAAADRRDGLRSLFRSEAERRFHRAVVEVFPHFLAVPNAALQALIEFEAVKDALTEEERAYFFRALVDVAVFDPNRDMRPVYLFELDSPFHDDPAAAARDAMKDRIVKAAGSRLYRIRPADARAEIQVFTATLRRITRPY